MLIVFVDADGCPVKDETYRVAERYDLEVRVVANRYLNTPRSERVESILVGDADGAADDWIVEHVDANDVVVTADIPLAARCLEKGASIVGLKGREFTEDTIGDALASRELSSQLREMGMMTGGPAPMGK